MAPMTPTPSQEAVTVAQLITSHASRSRRKRVPDFLSEVPDRLVARRHSKNRETPIMLYNSLKICEGRARNQLDHFFHLGICVCYDGVLEITKNIYEILRLSYLLVGFQIF